MSGSLGRFLARHFLTAAALVGVIYLLAPIVMMIALSFNHVEGRFNFVWHRFSVEAWLHPFAVEGLLPSLAVSVVLAILVAIVATAIGTALAYAQVRYSFYGSKLLDLVLLLTVATPEVISGSSLLDLFLDLHIPTGRFTIILSHIMFDIAFVCIMVKSRLRGFDERLEQAAMDLGATPARVFRLITLPLILPGVIAAGLLALVLSLDDYIITVFVSGQVLTFPLFVRGVARVAMPTQIYVVGTAMFVVLTAALFANFLVDQRRSRKMALA